MFLCLKDFLSFKFFLMRIYEVQRVCFLFKIYRVLRGRVRGGTGPEYPGQWLPPPPLLDPATHPGGRQVLSGGQAGVHGPTDWRDWTQATLQSEDPVSGPQVRRLQPVRTGVTFPVWGESSRGVFSRAGAREHTPKTPTYQSSNTFVSAREHPLCWKNLTGVSTGVYNGASVIGHQ